MGHGEMLAEIIERVLGGLAPRAIPAEPSRFAIAVRHARDRAGAVRLRNRPAVEIDRLVEAAALAIGPHGPPQWQRDLEQPAAKRLRLALGCARRGEPGRGAAESWGLLSLAVLPLQR